MISAAGHAACEFGHSLLDKVWFPEVSWPRALPPLAMPCEIACCVIGMLQCKP